MSGREVRKTVTVLFCDLVHSTGLAEGDPEAYRGVQSRFFEAMRKIVERHGGTVEKFIGDEVMAVFGVPVAHEDDALRAIRAAEEMQDALPGLELAGRIGINTGEVIAGDPTMSGSFVAGEPVILGKRLAQAAEVGEILIGKATYPLVKHALAAGPLERIPVKGKQDEIGRRRVDEIDREAPGVARRLHAPLVGREDELALLAQAFERTVEERSCRLFTILGPAGIGKSRLAAEHMSSVRDRAMTASGRCLPYGEGITFLPLADALQDLGGEEVIGEALENDQRDVVLGLLRGVTGVSETAGSSEETFWAVRRAFEALARLRPLVVCFEDLHWAEPTLLDLVEYVVGLSRGASILVLVLARPELVERRPNLIAPASNSDALVLEALSEAETELLLGGLADEIPLAADLRERIADVAEGNPLFVEQMAAMAAERNGEDELSVPPSIQALLAGRLDRLQPAERGVIERASIVGRDFPLAAVAALSPEQERGSLARHLLALVRKGLVRPDPSAEEDRFRFQHVLVRDSAYDAMPKKLRAKLHERFADWIEQSDGLEELVGYHVEQASIARTTVGLVDDHTRTLTMRAGKLLASAGSRALAREDNPAAIRLLERATALLGDDAGLLGEVLVDLGAALRECGDLARAETVLNDATETAVKAGREEIRSRALIECSMLRSLTDPQVQADDLLKVARDAIAVFEEAGDDLGLAKAWIHVADAHWLCGCSAKAEEPLERALAYADRVGSRRKRSRVLGDLARTAVIGPAPVQDAIRRCLQLRERGRGYLFLEARVDSALSVLEGMRGHFEEARRLYTQARAMLEDVGHGLPLATMQITVGITEMIVGEYETAERELRQGYEQLDRMGDRAYLSTMTAFLSTALYALGRYEEADKATLVSEEAASRDDIASQMIWRGTRAKVLARRGRALESEQLAREAVRLARRTDLINWQADVLVDLAETLVLLDRREEAAQPAREALRLYDQKGNVVSAAALRRHARELGIPVLDYTPRAGN